MYRAMKNDPKVKKYLDRLMKEQESQELKRKEKLKYEKQRRKQKERERERRRKEEKESRKREKDRRRDSHRDKIKNRGRKVDDKDHHSRCKGDKGKSKKFPAGKSPSDTTLYAPALVKDTMVSPNILSRIGKSNSNPGIIEKGASPIVKVIDQISNFVDNMRIRADHESRRRSIDRTHTTDEQELHQAQAEARKESDQAIIQAEKFKAAVNTPKGESNIAVNENLNKIAEYLRILVNNDDDEFFHITCHVESSLKAKIEKGEFIELEKLIPKNRTPMVSSEERKLQVMIKNGETYIGTAPDKETKINSIRRWEQAFRVYAAVYSNANPMRSAEIWQYVHTINTAAMSYSWENVYYYDVTFRQLMHSKPNRSWAKTYNQLWNLAMCDPLVKTSNSNYLSTNSQSADLSIRSKACWKWNKGKCTKWNCKYEHGCSYCGGTTHTYYQCRKRKSKQGNPNSSHSPNKKSKYNSPQTKKNVYVKKDKY